MKQEILSQLSLIETTQGIRIIHAVESGSRVWGFDSPNSDWDVRFLYIRPISWYLGVFERRDVVELPVQGLLDINGWDLKKALFLLSKSNPVLHEWLNSPSVYQTDLQLITQLRALAADYFNAKSATYHYLSLASGNFRSYICNKEEVELKKYLYIIRALLSCMWIEESVSMPPVEFNKLFDASKPDEYFKETVKDILLKKQQGGELGKSKPYKTINDWIEIQLAHFTTIARTAAVGKPKSDDLNDFMFHTLWSDIRKHNWTNLTKR